jgi:lipopolysaccharide/colanic/teichoic acid biosynthesis glycosyltransferase
VTPKLAAVDCSAECRADGGRQADFPGVEGEPCVLRWGVVGLVRNLASRAAKRAVDFTVSSAGLVALAVPFTLIATAIKLDSPGPIFYRGARVGRRGKTFRIFKFRSMRADASGPGTTSDDDQRITRVGQVIRKYKVDELSQLINVFIGDMSLVGPRPEIQWCVDLYTEEEKAILDVRPGITDWASIRFHNEGELIKASGYADADEAYLAIIRPEKLKLQLKYVRERSLGVDARILLETVATLVRTRLPAA